MTAPQTEATTDPQSIITALQQRLDAALAREAALADELAAQAAEMATRAAELADRKTEFDERIEHQAATADVLRVMSASPGDTQPVFDLIVRRAVELCNAQSGGLFEYDGERVHIGTIHGLYEHDGKLLHVQSLHGTEPDIAPASLAAYLRQFPMPPKRGSISMRAILDCQIMHIRDMQGEVDLLEDVQRLGHRSQVSLPLLRDARAIGVITIAAHEPGGFSESQIALLKTFAEQAVIAITSAETYRALQTRTGDLQETLEYQTATSDVLKVISGSEFDLAPVFQAVVETAARLCHADQATIYRYQDGDYRWVAGTSLLPNYERIERGVRDRPGTGTLVGRVTLEGRTVQIPDAWTDPLYELKDDARVGGVRTMLGVPLLRDGAPIGVIGLARKQIEPFTDRQIELVSTFADQAVIAIENTRLITEQREALEQQTATAEVLQVINASPGNLTPVFDAMLEKAMRLCGAAFGLLFTYDGEKFHMAATRGATAALAAALAEPWKPTPGGSTERLIRGLDIWQISDIAAPEWYDPDNKGRLMADLGGGRSTVWIALRKDDAFRGVIMIYRQEVRPFTDRQIALLQNFAAQAVIAMENARLINEQREALEQQTATAEVLQVINASPGNLAPVFDAMLEKAMRLSGAAYGVLRSYDGEHLHMLASRGVPTEYAEFLARSGGPGTPGDSPMPGTAPMQALETRQPALRLDVRESIGYTSGIPGTRAIADLGGARTCLHVPLVKDRVAVGLLTFYRQEVRAFSDKQIALLQNFAAQAVIAMENARLLTEQQEALEQQTATAEVLQVINASPGNLGPVFEAMLEKAIRLCEAEFGTLRTWDGERFHLGAAHGDPELIEWTKRQRPFTPINGNFPLGRIVRGAEIVRITDALLASYQTFDGSAILPPGHLLRAPDDSRLVTSGFGAMAAAIGFRSGIAVALRKDATLLGAISVYRKNEVRPFTDKQIALLQSFAAQAVIAMENARLLDEIRQRQEELRVTFENMGDGVAMFDETQYLAAWNRKFQDILDLPDALLGQRRTYEEHLRFLAARGDFGPGVDTVEQIEELVASTGQPYGYERTRPDGRVIEIRRNPVPDGGFVLIYSDITERKRSEEEIRAARDAAETALRELKTAQANLIQAEKMASLGQLTAGIAHEIKNPLNFVNNFSALSTELIDELRDVLAPEPLGETARTEVDDLTLLLKGNLEKVIQHGQRADGIVKAMLEHSRGSSGERRMVDLNTLIDKALNLAYHGARAQDQSFNITLERDFGEDIAPIEVNPQDITRVFLNLFANGFYATTKRARDGGDAGLVPTLMVATRDAGEAVEIRVRDNGTGIPVDIRDKLFQPFFTTKPTGEGTGLGLSITYDIVMQQHGGSITVDSKVGEYSEFTIQLPRNP